MQVANAVGRLDEHHARIGAVLTRAVAVLDAEPRDPVALAHLRWELLRLLREYQLFKHGELFDPLLRSADGSRRQRAGALKNRCLAMADAVTDHVRRWTVAGTADAASYNADARALIARLTQHLTEERQGVTQLLHGLVRTRQS